MKSKRLSLPLSVGIVLLLALSGFAQKKCDGFCFDDPNVEYTFLLPNDDWKMTVKPSPMSPNVEYVYKFRNEGHLQVRKIKVKSGALLSQAIRNEEQKLRFRPGFVAGKQENFRGAFSGRVFNYEFVRSGRNMGGRSYFLRFNDTVVYLIRFTGIKNKLRVIRNQTDSIARTFKKK